VPGVWAGLYCLPLFDSRDELARVLPRRAKLRELPPFVHVLTHKDLHLHPVECDLSATWAAPEGGWFARAQIASLGLPTPIRKLLDAKPTDGPVRDAA
jgi:A/G-specific adenine glycosylase